MNADAVAAQGTTQDATQNAIGTETRGTTRGARLRPPSVPRVRMGGFWGRRIATIRDVTAPILRRRCDEAGMMDQVDPARPVPALRIPFHHGHVTTQMFWDSDYGKTIETAAYCLAQERDPALEAIVDEVVDAYARLQQEDGYLSSWYQRMQPGKRWTNLRDCHELYCAGHLLEGAVAYFQATGKRTLLDVMRRYMDHIARTFGTGEGQAPGYCGHEEIELALVKLYRATGEEKYLELARYFVDQRGQEPNFFDQEAIGRGEDPRADWFHKTLEYNQSHVPVREQDKVVGHAVRAMYLFSGVADVAAEYHDATLRTALERLWADLVGKRIYVTGGMGPSATNEGFTADYDLPNRSAYAETCAAVGLVFWAQRMLGLSPDARFGDMLELALYNGALAGISLQGDTFFYENPLESAGDHHRWRWHHCPCCPPNIARLIASIGTYAYAEGADELAIHMYAASEAELHLADGTVRLAQATNYPWDGDVRISVTPDRERRFALLLRIPGWSKETKLAVNGEAVDLGAVTQQGYARIERVWRTGDVVSLSLRLAVDRIYAHPAVRDDAGRVTIRRGPLVYCLEGVDNPGITLNSIALPADASWQARYEESLLGGVTTLRTTAQADRSDGWDGELYRDVAPAKAPVEVMAIPYFAWDHRDPGEMLVWVRQV